LQDRPVTTASCIRDSFAVHLYDPLSARRQTEYAMVFVNGEVDVASRAVATLRYKGTALPLQWRVGVREAGRLMHEAAGEHRFANNVNEET
jgi:hypothetical protein